MCSWQCQIPIIKIVNLAEDAEQNFTNTWRLSNNLYEVNITLLQNLTGISKKYFWNRENLTPKKFDMIHFWPGNSQEIFLVRHLASQALDLSASVSTDSADRS